MLTEFDPSRRAGSDQGQLAAASDPVDQFCTFLHDGQVRAGICIEYPVEAHHLQSCNHFAGHCLSDRHAELFSQRSPNCRRSLHHHVLVLIIESIPDLLGIVALCQRAHRAIVDALAAVDAGGIRQIHVEGAADYCIETTVDGIDDPYCLDVFADTDAPPAEDALVGIPDDGDAAVYRHRRLILILKSYLIHVQLIGQIPQLTAELVGAGAGEGAMDAANILKPALARGELRSIGATTLNEYQKYFEKDKALERRFQTVMVDEPDELSAISILRGLKERYENHHKVRIQDDACIAAVKLSERYISDRFLPDKAIDLMDEAAAKLRMERDSVPEELDDISRQLAQLEIERSAISRETSNTSDSSSSSKLGQLDKEIAELREKENAFRARWENERNLVNKIQQDKQEMEQLRFEAERAEREGNYERVAEIRYSKLQALEEDIAHIQKQLASAQNGMGMVREEVTADDIAEVVSRWTGIPVTRMMQSEKEKLLHLEEELHKRVIGQDEAITAVSDAVRRSRAGLHDPKRPIASFIFLGTTGVGKTELAKALAEYLFNDESMMTRIDMSEYQEKHTVSRLIGAPPGYIGYDEGGQLTEAVRHKPYSVVLFDEIEKAHPDVFNILLQVLDDGRLTDNKGRTVNFKNTIIIMTSNLGSQLIRETVEQMEGTSNREPQLSSLRTQLMTMLKQTIRPEFLNRIDETIMFLPLTQQEIADVVTLQMKQVQRMLKEQDIQMEWTQPAIDFLTEVGYDPEFGARPVKRAIQHYVLNDLSKKLLAGDVNRDKAIIIDSFGEGLVFRN